MKVSQPRLVGALCVAVLVAHAAPAAARNPFGVMAGQGPFASERVLRKVRELGASCYRPNEVFVEGFEVTPGRLREIDLLQRSGLEVLLTVRNNGSNARGWDREPTSPPRDLARYKRTVGTILEAYRPKVLVVENEENAPPFYYDGTAKGVYDSPGDGVDTVEAYARELEAACEVAHVRGVTVANGGITSEAAAALTFADLVESGRLGEAHAFARAVFYTRKNPDAGEKAARVRALVDLPADLQQKIRLGRRLLDVYRRSAIDTVNFHWYIHDSRAFAVTAAYLRRACGKPLMSNEIGQWSWDNDHRNVPLILQAALDAKLSFALWYSNDAGDGWSLIAPDGALRPQGLAFQRFVAGLR